MFPSSTETRLVGSDPGRDSGLDSELVLPLSLMINGQPQQARRGSSVLDVVRSLGLESALVAVERNGEIVPRRQHGEVLLTHGDRLEIVTFVGGG